MTRATYQLTDEEEQSIRSVVDQYQLSILSDTDELTHLLLQQPDDDMHLHVHIVMCKSGTVLFGDPDFLPYHARCRGKSWFLTPMPNAEYLAGQFYKQTWFVEAAIEDLKSHVDDLLKEADEDDNCSEYRQAGEFEEILETLESASYRDPGGEFSFYDDVSEVDSDYAMEASPGYRHDAKICFWLLEIQKKCRKLYFAEKEKESSA